MSNRAKSGRRHSTFLNSRRASMVAKEEAENDTDNLQKMVEDYEQLNHHHFSEVMEKHRAFNFAPILYDGVPVNRDRNGNWWVNGQIEDKYKHLTPQKLEKMQTEELEIQLQSLSQLLHQKRIKHDWDSLRSRVIRDMQNGYLSPQQQMNHKKFDGPAIHFNGHYINCDRNHDYWIDGKQDVSGIVKMPVSQFFRIQSHTMPKWRLQKIAESILREHDVLPEQRY